MSADSPNSLPSSPTRGDDRLRGFIGVVHVPAMPGDPGYRGGGWGGVEAQAMADATALAEGGVDAIIVENFGSAPFPKGDATQRVPPHQLMTLGWIARVCRERFALPVGINCLRNDAIGAIGVAAAAGLEMVRVNVHMGAYVTDQGIIEGEAYETLRYRESLGARDITILADVLVKHASPIAPLAAADATKELVHRGHADGALHRDGRLTVEGASSTARPGLDASGRVGPPPGERRAVEQVPARE